MNFSIQRVAPQDKATHITELEDLLRSCVEGGASIGFMLPIEAGELKSYWEKVLGDASKGSRVILVASDESGIIVGTVQLALETRKNGRHRAEVQKLMVRPEARKDGLGAKLMACVEQEARAHEVSLLFLDTSEGAGGATHFYERLGYCYAGGIPGYALDPSGPKSKNAIYYKELGSLPHSDRPESEATRITIEGMKERHWAAVRSIYEEGIATGHSTFQSAAPETWKDFISGKVEGCNLIAVGEHNEVLGWAVLSPTSSRPVYAGVSEVSVYIAGKARGQGVGNALLAELIRTAETRGIWTLQSGTFPENEASIRLQQRHGFRIVGRRERMARMPHGPWAGRWRDVLLLERRSKVVGIS